MPCPCFDPDFTRAFVDGRMHGDFSHEHALGKVGVPILLMRARWMRFDAYGLVGAMDDQDVARVVRMAPQTQVRTFATVKHVVHRCDPKGDVRAVRAFGLSAGIRFQVLSQEVRGGRGAVSGWAPGSGLQWLRTGACSVV